MCNAFLNEHILVEYKYITVKGARHIEIVVP